MFDQARERLRAIRDRAFGPVLEPGEQILAVGLVTTPFIGSDAIELPSGADRTAEVVRRALEGVDRLPPLGKGFLAVAGAGAAVLHPFPVIDIDVDRLLGGQTGHGAVGSVAALFKAALARAGSADLLVTDRRLALAVDSSDRTVRVEDVEAPAKDVVVSVPRAVVRGVRRRRRPLEMGRIEFAFTDGSSITLTAGAISGRRAARFVDALVRSGPPGRPRT